MNIYPVPDALASKYHGAGHALVAIANGQLIDLAYLADALSDYDPGSLKAVISDQRLAPTVRQLQALGDVSVGMLSGWEFTEL